MEMNVEQKIKGEVSKQNCNTKNASFENIPEEIQIDILSRLPPESFSRCKFVSKHWNDTLIVKAFLVRQSRSYGKHPKLWFVVRSVIWEIGSVISFELDDDNTPKTTTLTVAKPESTTPLIRGQEVYFTDFPIRKYSYKSNICNDLICVFNPLSTHVGLLNIKTRDFIPLPAITNKCMNDFTSWYSLGFDPVHQVFKVLSISYRRSIKGSTTMAAILTVGSNYWNPIDYESIPTSVIKNTPCCRNSTIVCIDGVIYWVYKSPINLQITVVAFDLNHEAFRDHELVISGRNCGFRHCLTSLKEYPTLFIWKREYDEAEELQQWTLFNHKNPNVAAWKMRNFTNNFQTILPLGFLVARGSTLLQYSETINSERWYSLYDLEKFAIE